jgi:hypothetical protein
VLTVAAVERPDFDSRGMPPGASFRGASERCFYRPPGSREALGHVHLRCLALFFGGNTLMAIPIRVYPVAANSIVPARSRGQDPNGDSSNTTLRAASELRNPMEQERQRK